VWPDVANYNVIVTAVELRDQALRLTTWERKSYAARLGLLLLVSLEGTIAPGKCATFGAHVYAELKDLNQAYPGEDWRPMVVVVAHDPSVASQCRSAQLVLPDSIRGIWGVEA
jgi:hypothetical protein